MPVLKFRTFAEARQALIASAPADPADLAARVAQLWSMAAALTRPLDYRGVRKYRSIDEAGQDRERRSAERSRRD